MTYIRALSTLVAALALSACSDASSGMLHTGPHDAAAPAFAHNAVGDAEFGTTAGWADGKTVEFFYRKDFFCRQLPASGADSQCALGAEPTVAPRGGRIPVVYVMTPLGFRPDDATLHCPDVGDCINHPRTIDLSRIFGAGTENAELPAHSHVVEGPGTLKGASAGWWEIEVIGVTSPAVWDEVVQGKSLARVRELQAAGVDITPDLPTNLFLFFGVRP
jgi:hypothetical protein